MAGECHDPHLVKVVAARHDQPGSDFEPVCDLRIGLVTHAGSNKRSGPGDFECFEYVGIV